MPYKPREKVCQVCGITFMGEPRSKTCGRTCATRGANSRRIYKKGENHYNFKHCARQRHRKEYMAWMNMKDRCLRETNDSYPDYGGRGIKIFEPWINDFNAFFAHIGAIDGLIATRHRNISYRRQKQSCRLILPPIIP